MRPANEHPGTKEHHTYSREEGYQPAEYTPSEYPKVVGYEADKVTPIIANDAEQEAAFTAATAPAQEAPAAETSEAE